MSEFDELVPGLEAYMEADTEDEETEEKEDEDLSTEDVADEMLSRIYAIKTENICRDVDRVLVAMRYVKQYGTNRGMMAMLQASTLVHEPTLISLESFAEFSDPNSSESQMCMEAFADQLKKFKTWVIGLWNNFMQWLSEWKNRIKTFFTVKVPQYLKNISRLPDKIRSVGRRARAEKRAKAALTVDQYKKMNQEFSSVLDTYIGDIYRMSQGGTNASNAAAAQRRIAELFEIISKDYVLRVKQNEAQAAAAAKADAAKESQGIFAKLMDTVSTFAASVKKSADTLDTNNTEQVKEVKEKVSLLSQLRSLCSKAGAGVTKLLGTKVEVEGNAAPAA